MLPYRSFNLLLKCSSRCSKKYIWEHYRNVSKLLKSKDVHKIRNIGIIAHIDAGKTTTTERMLFYSGFMHSMGEVHDGDTVMDYMDQERRRGITITSAAITFNWKKHKINLIDTPGHVDFTFEVERSLSVLDGAIVILDSSAGVEVQTLKVWEQAKRYKVPSLIYLNKLDKVSSSVDMCLLSIKNKLKIRPLLLHYPLGQNKNFHGVVDLITLHKYCWKQNASDSGKNFVLESMSLDGDAELTSKVRSKREDLIESIADLDDEIADKYLMQGIDTLSSHDLQEALKRITRSGVAALVLCGSSYKNIAVQLLMDAIVEFLPSPSERLSDFEPVLGASCAVVFKIIHNKNKEPLSFIRLYSGKLMAGQRIYNFRTKCSERMGKIFLPLADDFEEIPDIHEGNIAVVTNLKNVATGDVLFATASDAEKIEMKLGNSDMVPLSTIQIPDPVFFCTVEPPSVGQQKQLDFALECLQREDPTFQVEVDEDIGQTILKGMGELHIDIIKDRILAEYGVEAYLGPLQVAYREAPEIFAEYTHTLEKTIGGARQFVRIALQIRPSLPKDHVHKVRVIVTKENDLGKLRDDYLKAINQGVKSALNCGPILGFPVVNLTVNLVWLEVGKTTSLSMLTAAASQCISEALSKSKTRLLEPFMSVSIAADKGHSGRVLSDLSHKRSQILGMELRQDVQLIQALTPLSELRGYSTHLRALTSGRCSFTIDFEKYEVMDKDEQLKAIQSVTGFIPT